MSEILTPLLPEYTIQIPRDPIALIFFGIWLVTLVVLLFRINRHELNLNRRRLFWLAGLSVLLLIFTPFLGLEPPLAGSSKLTHLPVNHLMLLAAVPWMVASGVLGTILGVLLAGMSGLLLAYFDTHHIFTPLILMTLAFVYGWFLNQRYRTTAFRVLRFPIVAALASLLVSLPLIFMAVVVTTEREMSLRIVLALEAMPRQLVALVGMLLMGSLFCVAIRALMSEAWGGSGSLIPAPGETSLKFRLLSVTLPLMLLLLLVLTAGLLRFNHNKLKLEVVNRLIRTATDISEAIPPFVDAGETYLSHLSANNLIRSGTPEQAGFILDLVGNSSSYFDQLILLNSSGQSLTSFPPHLDSEVSQVVTQTIGFEEILNSATPLVIPAISNDDGSQLQLNFFVGITNPEVDLSRILWGRTPLFNTGAERSAFGILRNFEEEGGEVGLINRENLVVYHSDPLQVMQPYRGQVFDIAAYFDGLSENGEAILQYLQPIDALDWNLVLTQSARSVYQQAWQLTYPVILFAMGVMLIVLVAVMVFLTPLTGSITQLTEALKNLSSGSFDIKIPKKQTLGEMGQLRDVFAGMAGSLQNRLLKQSDLYSVSKGVSGQQHLGGALDVIMKAALAQGVSSVRVVLSEAGMGAAPVTINQSYGLGKLTGSYAHLDSRINSHARIVGQIILQDHQIDEVLSQEKNFPKPAVIIAMPLRWENTWLGVFWVTYQDHQNLDPEMIEFFKALSQRASIAVMTLNALEKSKAMRRQLESVMDLLSDAVLFVDDQELVVYHNQLASKIFGGGKKSLVGVPFTSLVNAEEPIEFLTGDEKISDHKEIQLKNGSVFQKFIQPVALADRTPGKIILLRDITRRKVTDSTKTEFVTMVSHELRSPLTLVHGYAKILRLTGNLNEQQDASVAKIIEGIEEMKHLVQNLLDIGRLEAGTSLDLTRFSLDEFVQKLVDGMDAQAKQKNVAIRVALPEQPVLLEADATFLTQALKNLLDNAIKFSRMGGDVQFTAQWQVDRVLFTVRDEGIGIAPLDQRNIFNRFQRTSSLVGQENSGSGLGLAIVRSVAERHGGKVWLESQLGKGSTFYLEIPQHGK
ncbi:MAG: HAMP domain-containing sensor histidine kinase [Brevefilum sp.]|jgi:signal transduction histidine kinase/HAMP domain-containing protein